MTTPIWVTPAGTLGTIPQGVFYNFPLVATAGADTVYYKVIAGVLPPGTYIDETGILSGNPSAKASIEGTPLPVINQTTDTFVVRAFTASGSLADRTFSLTITDQSTVVWLTPAGQVGEYIDGTQITDLKLLYEDTSIYATDVVTLIAGSLPPGLTVSTTGVISGYITPNPNATQVETDYSFTLRSEEHTSELQSH